MLSKKFMVQFGVALGPVTVVLMDTIMVSGASSNELVSAFRGSAATLFIAWTVALFMGHWFHPVDGMKPGFGHLSFPWNYVIFAGLTALVAVLSFAVINTAAVAGWLPALMVLLGFVAGWLLWPV